MEVLYSILMLGFVVLAIMLLILLFRGKNPTEKPPRKFETSITKIFHGFWDNNKTPMPTPSKKSEYQLTYNAQDSINETMREPAIEVKVTHVRDASVHTTCCIQDDEHISREGVTIGRENCHYNMSSMLIDKKGTFMLKRVGDSFIILGAKDSVNGIKKTYRGERVKRIEFADGKATCYVGPIRFDFRIPGEDYEEAFVHEDDGEARFFSADTISDSLT